MTTYPRPAKATTASLNALLRRAHRLGWPQLLYRSPILNERYIIPAGRAAWQAWAGDALGCDVVAAGDVVSDLEADRKQRTETERTGNAHD